MRKLLLFDIDGTLVWGGPAKQAFERAMVEVFGTAGPIATHAFSGKTDPQIARELLLAAGVENGTIEARFPELWARYTRYLEELLVARPMDVLPGVAPLLEVLGGFGDVGLGLLTGNILRGAELKLRSAGLSEHFRMGSYGSDHEERDELAEIALRRAVVTWGVKFDPRDVFVLGDTPRDVQCGHGIGAKTVAVATGHHPADRLRAAGADHVLDDFTDTEAVVALLTA
jgi:phosphoglycolate phosphatase-like HAD superfamily hydrolase